MSDYHILYFNHPAIERVQCNLSTEAGAAKAFKGDHFDFVINLAAETKYGQNTAVYEQHILDLARHVGKQVAEHKPEKFIQFSYEGIVEKYRFNDNNKIDATYLTIWTEDGSGFIGKVADKHVERMQKTVNIICGIE